MESIFFLDPAEGCRYFRSRSGSESATLHASIYCTLGEAISIELQHKTFSSRNNEVTQKEDVCPAVATNTLRLSGAQRLNICSFFCFISVFPVLIRYTHVTTLICT